MWWPETPEGRAVGLGKHQLRSLERQGVRGEGSGAAPGHRPWQEWCPLQKPTSCPELCWLLGIWELGFGGWEGQGGFRGKENVGISVPFSLLSVP